MLDFLFSRGKGKSKAEKAPGEATATEHQANDHSRDEVAQKVFDVLEYGTSIKPGDTGFVGDCSSPGNDPTPCEWTLVKGERGDKKFRIIL
jgi:hypothetical protein